MSAVGIEPRSLAMKVVFGVYGVVWLAVVAAFAVRQPWACAAMLALAVGSPWYLVVGTVASAIVVALLLLPAVRAAY